ncbi:MAG: hypothetical protein ACFBZ8_13415 [Opitutales bacterium]
MPQWLKRLSVGEALAKWCDQTPPRYRVIKSAPWTSGSAEGVTALAGAVSKPKAYAAIAKTKAIRDKHFIDSKWVSTEDNEVYKGDKSLI